VRRGLGEGERAPRGAHRLVGGELGPAHQRHQHRRMQHLELGAEAPRTRAHARCERCAAARVGRSLEDHERLVVGPHARGRRPRALGVALEHEHRRHELALARAERSAARRHARGGRRGEVLERAQGREHRGAVARPVRWIAREHAAEQLVELVGRVRPALTQARRLVEQHARQRRDDAPVAPGLAPRERGEEHAAERVDVDGRPQRSFSTDLLGGHEPRGADGRARARQRSGVEGASARDPEVDELRSPRVTRLEQHVAGLEIAVHHAPLVRGAERAREPLTEREGVVERERSLREASRQIDALEPLHHQVARLERAVLVRRQRAVRYVAHDGLVLEPRQHQRLALEALDQRLRTLVQHLDGDRSARAPVAGAVHRPHAATAHEPLHLEALLDQRARRDPHVPPCVTRPVASMRLCT
jgi:hypothetical protein